MTHVPNVVLVLLRNYVIEVHSTQLLVKEKVVLTRDPKDFWEPVSTA